MKTNKKNSILKMVLVGLFAAMISVISIISIPTPFGIPVTLQTFIIALCGYFLGWNFGSLATLVYILVGAMGIPVFSGIKGGIGVLFGVTGGFLWGFILLAFYCGLGAKAKSVTLGLFAGIIGIGFCHLLGIIQYSAITQTSFKESFVLVSMSFLLKDIISVGIAYFISKILKKSLHKSGIFND